MPISNPLFSLVIPARNEEKMLSHCIAAIKNQSGDFSYEIIVVNNGSTDQTESVAKELGVKVINEKRPGVGQARKIGTEQARGKYVMHVDADTRLPKNYFSEVSKRFQKNPHLKIIGGQMYYYDAPWWINLIRPVFHWSFYFLARILSWGRVGPMGHNMTFTKETYDKTNGFDGTLCYGEDMDICRKISKFGEVKLDMSLKCLVSSRRFVPHKSLWTYVANFFHMLIFKKPYKNKLSSTDNK